MRKSIVLAAFVTILSLVATTATAGVFYYDGDLSLQLDSYTYTGEKFGQTTDVSLRLRKQKGDTDWGSLSTYQHYEYVYNKETDTWTPVVNPNKRDVYFAFGGTITENVTPKPLVGDMMSVYKLFPNVVNLNQQVSFATQQYSEKGDEQDNLLVSVANASITGNFVVEGFSQVSYYERAADQWDPENTWRATGYMTLFFPGGLPQGMEFPGVTAGVVPEPATAGLLALGGIAFLSRRRR